MDNRLLLGDCREVLKTLPAESVHCVVTSPPYFGLRSYLPDGHPDKAREIGLEETPDAFVANLVEVFREVRRVLRGDGVCWINLGDSYAGAGYSHHEKIRGFNAAQTSDGGKQKHSYGTGLKNKDLIGIPWRVAFALQADGWWLRQDIIWCLSGGTWLYVRSQKGDMPMTVKDMARLDPATVQLWNGEKWTQLLGMSKSNRRGDELEIVLRSGERISCTPTHRFPTANGLKPASELRAGDCLIQCRLPEPEHPKDCAIDEDAAWFAGLYLAEGSRSEDTIQIAGHVKETARWDRVQRIAAKFGGSATMTENGNTQGIRVYGKVLNAIIDELVTGKTARNKGFAPVVWRYSNRFVDAMLDGYLSGDGHLDNDRWRLGFCRNYNLERDLRTACARLGYTLTLNIATVPYNGRQVATFRGELRKRRSGHWNEKKRSEIVEIRKARCRQVYDLGVADEPHVFALASGVMTHNSKPNPMPESCTDRCTKSHEYVFLLSKNSRYWYDAEAVKEDAAVPVNKFVPAKGQNNYVTAATDTQDFRTITRSGGGQLGAPGIRNRRSVWTVATQPYSEAHFATFPAKLIEPMILAGCPAQACAKCGKGWERVVERERKPPGRSDDKIYTGQAYASPQSAVWGPKRNLGGSAQSTTLGHRPACTCEAESIPGTVLDPFFGSGTVGQVCERLGRRWIGIDLNDGYTALQKKRTAQRGLALGAAS